MQYYYMHININHGCKVVYFFNQRVPTKDTFTSLPSACISGFGKFTSSVLLSVGLINKDQRGNRRLLENISYCI